MSAESSPTSSRVRAGYFLRPKRSRNRGISFPRRQTESYKVLSPEPRTPFASKPQQNQIIGALFELDWISPSKVLLTAAVSSIRASPGQTKLLGEFAVFFSTPRCPWIVVWCTESRVWSSPASSPRPSMAPPRRRFSRQPACRHWPPGRARAVGSRSKGRKHTPSLRVFLKRPWVSLKSNPQSLAPWADFVLQWRKRNPGRLTQNTLSVFYKFAIEIVLLIKYSF